MKKIKIAQDSGFLDAPVPSAKAPVAAQPAKAGPTSNVVNKPQTTQAPQSAAPSPAQAANPAVAKMQAALIRIRKEFLTYEIFNGHGTHEAGGGMVSERGFITSILDRTVNKSTNFNKEKTQTANKPWTFINRLDSILGIGSKDSKGQIKPDGVWGKNTNLALKGMADIIETVHTVSEKLTLPQSMGISKQDIDGLKKSIPADPSKEAHLTEKAEHITTILESLEEKIARFANGLHSNYDIHEANQTGMDAGYGMKQKSDDSVKNLPGANSAYLSGVPQDISNPKSEKLQLSLSNLSSLEALKSFMQSQSVTVEGKSPLEAPDNSIMNRFLDHLRGGVASGQISVSANPTSTEDFSDPWKKK